MPLKRNRTRRIFLWTMLIIATVIVCVVIYFKILSIDHPPPLKDSRSLDLEREEYGKYIYTYGNNWLRKSESGLWEAYIEGKPFERGVAFGSLTSELLYYQEASFVEQIKEIIPSESYLKFLKYFIAFFNRNLNEYVPYEYRQEIYGTSFSASSEYDFIGSAYQRQLNY